MTNPLTDPSQRRLLVVLLAPLFALLSSKFGIVLSDLDKELVIGLAAAYILGGNAKEAAIARAKAAETAAAAKVAPGPEADAVVAAAAKGTP